LLGHPAIGGSYEAMVIENLLQKYPHYEPSFYRTSNGAEIDLVLEKGTSSIVFEIKSSSTPILSKGFYTSLKDLNPDEAYVIAQIDGTYPINSDISAYSLDVFLKNK
jgi:predicted AAA+ superfamily ATPase